MKRLIMMIMSLLLTTGAGKVWAQNAPRDTEAIAVLEVINQNEIQAAQAAAQKTTDKKITEYAAMIEKEHSKNLDQTMEVSKKNGISPTETPTVKSLRAQGVQDSNVLKNLAGEEFSSAYIAVMLKGHQEALDLIDTQFSENIQNHDLKKHIAETRKHIADHLKKAQEIQNDMVKKGRRQV